MKILGFLAASLIGLVAYSAPMTGDAVCKRINNTNDRLACYQIIDRAYIDQNAAGACDRIESGSRTLECLRAIANKYYTTEQVRRCDREESANATVRCFEMTGDYANNYPRPNPPNRPDRPERPGRECYVRDTNSYMFAEEFYNFANRVARTRRTCVIANVANNQYSYRAYNSYGEQVAQDRGNLSAREIESIARAYDLYNCQRFTCE